MKHAYIALGSNIAPRDAFLADAIALLAELKTVHVVTESAVYETPPVGYEDQHDFLNMVINVQTSLSPMELLSHCQAIEQELGRKRVIKWGPRTIDLDILLFQNETVNTDRLTIPHPRMHERAFVMVPLAEIAPTVNVTEDHTVKDLLNNLPDEDIKGVKRWKKKDGGNGSKDSES
ncbi:2-amino-4-hydroxy-6-hydroxymethyldihydropteridine diphosphokinase [Thalassobacillus sp. CUG 92003]|uniref:2-amino-4-hydroxy-6- hydroxymethyldihydropteridine diphosphokinase n=1 Tax=Thalassobacillus sp. CUG 92003 TaxID=2736641 RepID=UPI0015E748E1|nr:2-amino-4-hydroxy-6-hydroxymethyldihydropteridine diphosphokinase [Thalassobacillus sp. CUG 92003]